MIPVLNPRYRTHTCGQLRAENVDQRVTLSGWVHGIRDHGHLIFIDLRDHFGITQLVVQAGAEAIASAKDLRVESVISIEGYVKRRLEGTNNPNLVTGE